MNGDDTKKDVEDLTVKIRTLVKEFVTLHPDFKCEIRVRNRLIFEYGSDNIISNEIWVHPTITLIT